MIIGIVVFIVAFLVVATMLSRQTKSAKKQAVEDLKAEKESVGTFNIFELVESEINSLGLLDIEGAQDLEHAVLLKVWSDSDDIVASCAGREHLRYVVAGGVKPADATENDVTLECTQTRNG
jgi:septation ring formation regulator EzrA